MESLVKREKNVSGIGERRQKGPGTAPDEKFAGTKK